MNKSVRNLIKKVFNKCGYEVCKKSKISLPSMNHLNMARLLYFKRIFDQIKDIDGDIVECGVYQGNSLLMLALLIYEEMKGRKLWGFDSFEGFPELASVDKSPRNLKKGDFSNTSISTVLNLLEISGLDSEFIHSQITLVKGYFNESLNMYKGTNIAFLHLDVDLYDSYLTTLNAFFPKLSKGGIVAFDEYMGTIDHLHYPGAQKAIDEYFGEKKSMIQRDSILGKYYLIK